MMNKIKNYLANPKLKRVGEQIPFTEEQGIELVRSEMDPVYFCKNYVKIIHVDRGMINFDPYDFQKDIVRSFVDNRFTIICSCRQAGKTTSVVAAILHYILFSQEKGKLVAILANKGSTSREIMARVKLAYENLPLWMQQGVKEWNKGSIELENECRVIAAATSSSSIRGLSVSMLVIDETAFVENWNEFFTSTLPTIASGDKTKVCLVSTPNGLNHFYKLWVDANKKGDEWNGYNPISVTWQDVPGRDEVWAKTQRALIGDTKFKQEHEIAFLGSTHTLIDANKLSALPLLQPIKEAYAGSFVIYEDPIPGAQYAIVADVGEGKGLDDSAFSLIRVDQLPYVQVARYCDNFISTLEYGDILANVGSKYNDAVILVELNNIGRTVVDYMRDHLEYENLIATENKGSSGKQISGGGSSYEFGIRTTKTVKQTGCSYLKELIENDQLLINDAVTIEQLSRFSRVKNSFQAEVGYKDDVVMSLVLFAWLAHQSYFIHLTNTDSLSKLREKSDQQIMEHLVPIGFSSRSSSQSSFISKGYMPSSFEHDEGMIIR